MSSFDSETKTWSGPKVPRDGENLTFREEVLNCLTEKPEKVFQISDDEGTELTFDETKTLSIRVAQNLKRFGVGKGDVVAVLMNNSTYVAPIVFGSIFLGAPLNPLVYGKGVTIDWVKHVFNTTKPKVFIMEQGMDAVEVLSETVKSLGFECTIFLVKPQSEIQFSDVHSYEELIKPTGDEENFQ